MKLSDKVAKVEQRVGALETAGFDDAAGIARISKIYGNIRITTTMTFYLHTYRKCGDTNPLYPATCGTDAYI